MAKKVILIDYVGQVDEKGQPVGHSLKTLVELCELLEPVASIELIIPKSYERDFPITRSGGNISFSLKFSSCIHIWKFSHRVAGIWGKLRNLVKVWRAVPHLRSGEDRILWFTHPDFLLYIFLYIYPFRIKSKILLTLYMEGFDRSGTLREKIKHFFFTRSIHKVTFVMKNSKNIEVIKKDQEIFYPDYLYKEEKYKPYILQGNTNTGDYVLCTGVMNWAKDILTLVDVWHRSKISIKLKIRGYFPDKTIYRAAIEKAGTELGKRIEITDCYPSEDEYYREISGARWIILPYREATHIRRTSGILLESIFLGTPAIAPRFLLDFTDLPGIAYDQLDDLEKILATLSAADEKHMLDVRREMAKIREEYSIEKVRERILQAL